MGPLGAFPSKVRDIQVTISHQYLLRRSQRSERKIKKTDVKSEFSTHGYSGSVALCKDGECRGSLSHVRDSRWRHCSFTQTHVSNFSILDTAELAQRARC